MPGRWSAANRSGWFFAGGGLTITAVGTPLQNGSIGDFIPVRNIESGVVISGTVMDDGSVRVAAK